MELRQAHIALIMAAACLAAWPGAAEKLRFDFESGTLEGWRIVEGGSPFAPSNRAKFHNRPQVDYNKHGAYFLTTLELEDGVSRDAMTGVIESPVFIIEKPIVGLLVGGGGHASTYAALCTLDGTERLYARGPNDETMQRVIWDASQWVDLPVFVRVVDRHQGGWGHITLDNVVCSGRLAPEAEADRDRLRETARLEALKKALATHGAPLRGAIAHVEAVFGPGYAGAPDPVAALAAIEAQAAVAETDDLPDLVARLEALRRRVLTANPLLTAQPILFVTRPQYKPDHHNTATMFQNGEINTGSFAGGGAMKTLDVAQDGAVTTLLEVPEGIIRDPEISYDGTRVLFSMRRDIGDDYHIYEMPVGGGAPRQLTFGAEISDIDPFYLPNGQIGFSSTREPKYCQCNRHIMANLFVMEADGTRIRQIGHNTLFEGHGAVMPDGRILYDRWEYVDRHFGPSFGLWTAGPDGTNHALYYGNNAWSPGGIIDARPVPGTPYVVTTYTSCHDRPWGALAIVDRRRGMDGQAPVIHSWPADLSRFLSVDNGGGIDVFKQLTPKYEDPYPLSAEFFLCSRAVQGERMGLFLVDVFGNELLLHDEAPGCYDPMPVAARPRPPEIPPRTAPAQDLGYFYVHDVYQGAGMERVPRGTIRYLRVVEAPPKLHWTHTLWNVDATQAPAMNWNLTNNKRILGDAPVAEDGSAYFSVPSGKFVYFQALDKNKMMVQSMRSGTMAAPGETTGCVGCHENRLSAVPNNAFPAAMRRPPAVLEPWYGPERDFNYLTEVQPVFDKHCVKCHDYGKPAGKRLNLAGDLGLVFNTSYIELRSKSAVRWFADEPGGKKLLVKAVDDGPPEVLPPYAWGSHRSKLADAVRGGHKGTKLTDEEIARVITWIDLNAVYYGEYGSAYPDHPFGRSPLDTDEVARLRALTGVKVADQKSEMQTSQVNFTRPELSPCLAKLAPDSDAYAEALALIREGQQRLAQRPRADMPGFELVRPIEIKQREKFRAHHEAQEACDVAAGGEPEAAL